MLEVVNHTPLAAALVPWLDRDGGEHACVIVKGTFAIDRSGRTTLGSEQAPIVRGDQYGGEPGESGLRYASDMGPPKPATDVALLGHAYARGGRAREGEVAVSVGPLRKLARIFGERRWFRNMLSWEHTAPAAFDRVPLTWERAFGGRSGPEAGPPQVEWRNPVGTGFWGTNPDLEGVALPNVEDPNDLITSPKSNPAPVAFGFIAPHWLPRRTFAGTYDERWQKERCPYLPTDFDERFFNAAAPGLLARPHLRGGEPVDVLGVSPGGRLTLSLPRPAVKVRVLMRGQRSDHDAVLDTVVIEPDVHRVLLTWKVLVPCFRKFLAIQRVTVTAEGLA